MTARRDFGKARRAGKAWKRRVLLPYQRRWVRDKATVKVIEKSRRVGISWAEAADDALYAARKPGGDVWYIGYNKDMALEFVGDCADWARHYSLAAGKMEEFLFADEDRDIAAFRIRFSSGKRVTALSSRPTNLRGKQGRVVIDEAAFHADLAGLLKAAMALTMWGGDVRIISTHNGEDNPFNDLVKDIRAGRKPYGLHRVDLDEALGEGLYKRICRVLGRAWSAEAEREWKRELMDFYGESAREELFCVPSRGGGAYLSRALIESCMSADIPVLRWRCDEGFAELPEEVREAGAGDWCEEHLHPLLSTMDPGLATYLGEDFGRSGDLTVLMPLQRRQDLSLRAPFVVELGNVPFRQQEQILFYIIDRLPGFRSGAFDARGNGQYLAEVAMQRYGNTRIRQVTLSTGWYRENMPRYKAAFEDRSITLPRDADILDDHRALRMEKGVARVPGNLRATGTDGGQRHGDSAIAGALGLFSVNAEVYEPIHYEALAAREAGFGSGGW
jgi:phage FluMu gp28-like protein